MDWDDVDYDYDYTSHNDSGNSTTHGGFSFSHTRTALTPVLAAVNALLFVCGLVGNLLVLWVCGCRMKRTVMTSRYISLSVSNLLFCCFLPFDLFYMLTLHWPFGALMCKLASSGLFLNMYSSVFLLVLISVDRCVMVCCPIWSQNHATPRRAAASLSMVWGLSSLLTLPSLVYRHTTTHGLLTQCYSHYTTRSQHRAVAHTRFVCGFVVPFLIIVVCGAMLVVQLQRVTLRSSKPYRVLAALVCGFFCCWVPYHTFILLEVDLRSSEILHAGLQFGTTLAAAHSLVSPVCCVFIGRDFKRILKQSLASRTEAALAEDVRSARRHSRSKSIEVLETQQMTKWKQ